MTMLHRETGFAHFSCRPEGGSVHHQRPDLVLPSPVSCLGKHSRRDTLLSIPPLIYASNIFQSGSRGVAYADELAGSEEIYSLPNYAAKGPLEGIRLPRLAHTCTTCNAPADRCRIRINAWVPKGGSHIGLYGRFPLAVISPGFLITADQYSSYARRLAEWGYVAVVYDFVQQALDPSSDLACVDLLEELLTWCGNLNNPIGSLCDSNNILLIGHSRGAKISSLVASKDPRVKALYLIDPVDVTVYTPLSPEFPSAASALESSSLNQQLPVAIVGSGSGSDCAPSESSYNVFYKAARGPTWQGIVQSAGHLQFLDARSSTAMGLVCQASANVTDGQVEDVARAMMIAWAESMIERSNNNDVSEMDRIQKILMCNDDGQVRALSVAGNRSRENVRRAIDNTEHGFSSISIDFVSKNLNQT
eukprot:jgi/Picsp_1/5409/NSC_02768-R1_protein